MNLSIYKMWFFLLILITALPKENFAQHNMAYQVSKNIKPGAYDIATYLPLLQNKRVALVINQTSEINGTLLPDTLLQHKVNIKTIFSPEHGFRGTEDAGATVGHSIDKKTGIKVISLYGKNKQPTQDQLKDIDVVVYDLQDVGVRFYTYISTLEYLIEACGLWDKQLIILDRPNPLGGLVDGPILDMKHHSFVGMRPIPVIYGMTPGEYAKMLVGENWIKQYPKKMNVIACQNYTRNSIYELPVAPSPNLKNMAAIYLYPSTCFFEGTAISLGRGTDFPFQQFGHPSFKGKYKYHFTPISKVGASDPKLKDQVCYGKMISNNAEEAYYLLQEHGIQLSWLIEAYEAYVSKDKFFINYFEKLSGTDSLRMQIQNGTTATEIKNSWQEGIKNFQQIRKKYLIYNDK